MSEAEQAAARLCARWEEAALKSAASVALFLLRIPGTARESAGNCCQRVAVSYLKSGPG